MSEEDTERGASEVTHEALMRENLSGGESVGRFGSRWVLTRSGTPLDGYWVWLCHASGATGTQFPVVAVGDRQRAGREAALDRCQALVLGCHPFIGCSASHPHCEDLIRSFSVCLGES